MGTGRGCATVMAGLGGGERRSTVFGPLEGLRTTLTGQKEARAEGILTESWDGGACRGRGGRRRGRAETAGRRWWRGRKRAVSCVLVPRADSGRCCESATGSGEVQESPAARNRVAGHSPAGMASGEIPARWGLGSGAESLGSSPGLRRIYFGLVEVRGAAERCAHGGAGARRDRAAWRRRR